jgi:UDP-2,3-diacylglucosamine pyrophosphatase LpxH
MVTLLVSDVHLGSPLSRAGSLLQLLKRGGFDRLILLGDMFSSMDFTRLRKEDFQLIDYIRKLSNPKRGIEEVWVGGNHDFSIIDVMTHLVGIPAYEKYTWEWNGRTCVAIHGHQFDGICANNPWYARLISFFYLEAQKIPFFRRLICIWLDKVSAKWQRLTPVVAERAIAYARNHGFDVIFCGHTHETWHEKLGITSYFNTGAWVGPECTYIWMTDDKIEQRTFVEEVTTPQNGDQDGRLSVEA